MAKIRVYPAKASALNLRHPIDGKLGATGGEWTEDGFTARLLTDGAITRDAGAALPAPGGEARGPALSAPPSRRENAQDQG